MAEFQAKREQKEASSSKSSDNTGAMRPPPARVRRDVESLGWMTESTKMPKKQRVIDGVGAGSLVDLKAQLYRTQEAVKRKQDGVVDPEDLRQKSKLKVFEKANSGVESRDKQDKLQLKSTTTADCYLALEKKAALYERIARGEVVHDDDVYNVDFVRKGYLEDEPPSSSSSRHDDDGDGNRHGIGGMTSTDMEMQREREAWEAEVEAAHAAETQSEDRRRESKQNLKEIHAEAKDQREKTQSLKERRTAQAERNRERLKAAFLKKQVQKLRQQSNGGNNNSADRGGGAVASAAAAAVSK
mmetsp:Transcript_13075/g.22141  ORF Transcript_13075/g.22141 Transcript_13075/m.22141 type:complete len:300 (-) Transcript_13075:328-1227(-)|eukprot:CAMPEP_0198202682 /NCGR_PEP_ID=MMETSP1445-20131203/5892_1 /TAXON_ID=36898 /ORGANISM="Pyramimonas sp., Strain CCMP2087" /LENGTH=299 /DNA_ID=CAMNT_0043873731 /DNA_START=308 /DNA_END=1207 /DNA_ORIENTATION=+